MAKSSLFLRLNDKNGGFVLGECYDKKHQSEIDLLGWDWDVRDPAVASQADKSKTEATTSPGARGKRESESGGGKANQAAPSVLSISKATDRSTTRLLGAMDRGEIFPKAILTIEERYEESPLPFHLKIVLTDVFILDFNWNVSADGAGMTLKEDWKLNYSNIVFSYHWRGGTAGWIPCSFDRPPEEASGSSNKIPPTKSEKDAKADADFEERFNARVKKLGLHK
jgi:type VI protein secretion system component Hcp